MVTGDYSESLLTINDLVLTELELDCTILNHVLVVKQQMWLRQKDHPLDFLLH